jgi:DoxX-like family
MKKINIIYWISTVLILAMMLWSAISSLTDNPQGVKIMSDLGYPAYLGHFLAVAKVLAIIASLVPGFPKLKEWAYAGLAFDMIGAMYSMYAVGEPASKWAFMLVFIAVLFCSYIFYHKKLKLKATAK